MEDDVASKETDGTSKGQANNIQTSGAAVSAQSPISFQKRLIVLTGAENVGKTMSLHVLICLLAQYNVGGGGSYASGGTLIYPQGNATNWPDSKALEDLMILFDISGVRILVNTWGDSVQDLRCAQQEIVNNQVDIAILATRPEPNLLQIINAIELQNNMQREDIVKLATAQSKPGMKYASIATAIDLLFRLARYCTIDVQKALEWSGIYFCQLGLRFFRKKV